MQHAKLPVSRLQRSGRWYIDVCGLELAAEFTERGIVRGVALRHRTGDVIIALRDRAAIPGHPDLEGFDAFALGVLHRDVVRELADRCDAMGPPRGETEDRPDGTIPDTPDPDGTVIRCCHYTHG